MTNQATSHVMALDLGTTGNRAIIFDREGQIAGQAYRELTQSYPQPGWVEHDPAEIWQAVRWAMQAAVDNAGITAQQIAAVGVTVQRETCLLWDKTTGEPLHPAIVWQDRRTAPLCQDLRQAGHVEKIYDRTGLVLDAYFSASKLAWLIDWVKRHRDVNWDNVLAGTIDTWAIWNLTGGRVHATDHSNASRTMLLNISDRDWDSEMLALFNIPRHIMPTVQPSLSVFGHTDKDLLGVALPIAGVFGDQQAALYAHGCDRPGLLKCTYGTGAFLVSHTGEEIMRSTHQLLTTVAWTQGQPDDFQTGYAIEGSMFTAGACVQWLRDGLQIIQSAAETGELAASVSDNGGVYFAPALSGLGAPHWDMAARGAFLGITRGVTRAHMVRAVLEAIAYQACEVVEAINKDSGTEIKRLKVDGGACNNDFLMQFQADALGIPVERPAILDATAQGAAFGAGLTVGFWEDYRGLIAGREIDKVFEPSGRAGQVQENFALWSRAVERAKGWVV